MDRLTRRGTQGEIWIADTDETRKVGRIKAALEKLYAYESSGKTPAEVAAWAKAEQEGRLVVLPCKVGDEIYSFKWSIKNNQYEVHTGKVKSVRYEAYDGTVTVSDGERYCVWGKTVFLTREEAEQAKERGKNG